MSNSGPSVTSSVLWRRLSATIPAVALIGGGVSLAPQSQQARTLAAVTVSTGSHAIEVPEIAMTMRAVPPPISSGPGVVTAQGTSTSVPPAGRSPKIETAALAPPLALPVGTLPGSSTPLPLDSPGIPARALQAYRAAASLVAAADPSCNIDWALLAAIGRVESDHARFGGNQLDEAGVAQPGIIGIPLNGTNATALITDSDGGLLDHDSRYDRAVGPMQFIPGTWRSMGSDGNGDGVKNPQDMNDAATSTAVYLCSGPGDVSRPGDLRAAIMRYNPSDSYARMVTAIADGYRHGVRALSGSELPAATPASPADAPILAKAGATSPATTIAGSPSVRALAAEAVSGKPTSRRPGSTPSTPATGRQAALAASGSESAPRVVVPRVPGPRVSAPRVSVPRVSPPQVVVPRVPVPPVSVPQVVVPRVPVPPVSAPQVVVPRAPVPPVSAPQVVVPRAPVPPVSAPPVVVPPVVVPPVVPTPPGPLVPCLPVPAVTNPVSPSPTVTGPVLPDPAVTGPVLPTPAVTDPAVPVTCLPIPTPTVPCLLAPTPTLTPTTPNPSLPCLPTPAVTVSTSPAS